MGMERILRTGTRGSSVWELSTVEDPFLYNCEDPECGAERILCMGLETCSVRDFLKEPQQVYVFKGFSS